MRVIRKFEQAGHLLLLGSHSENHVEALVTDDESGFDFSIGAPTSKNIKGVTCDGFITVLDKDNYEKGFEEIMAYSGDLKAYCEDNQWVEFAFVKVPAGGEVKLAISDSEYDDDGNAILLEGEYDINDYIAHQESSFTSPSGKEIEYPYPVIIFPEGSELVSSDSINYPDFKDILTKFNIDKRKNKIDIVLDENE